MAHNCRSCSAFIVCFIVYLTQLNKKNHIMKKIAILSVIAVILFSCGNQKNKQVNDNTATENEAVVFTVDDLYANAAELEGKEVIVKGTVMHVCTHGGARCFLMGSNEDFNIRIEAGEKIGTFSQEQIGSDLTIAGILKQVRTEAEAHNPSKEHGIESEDHDEEAENAHQIIAAAQEKVEVVYFLEGISILKEEI